MVYRAIRRDRGATPARRGFAAGGRIVVGRFGRPRGIRRDRKAGSRGHYARRLPGIPCARPSPASRRRCKVSRSRASPRPRRPAATATERISASSAALPRHDEAGRTLAPIVARWAITCRSVSSRSTSSSLQPRRNEAACSAAIAAGVARGFASDSVGAPRANRRRRQPIIGAPVAPRPAAARRARAGKAASAAHRFPTAAAPSRATQSMSGAWRCSTRLGARSPAGQAAASSSAAVPTMRGAPVAAATRSASRKRHQARRQQRAAAGLRTPADRRDRGAHRWPTPPATCRRRR